MSFYQMFSAYYNTIFPFAQGKEIFFTKLINNYKPKSALDLGCATGELSSFLNNNGCRTIGIDLSPDLLRLAQGKAGDFVLADMVEYLRNQPIQKKDLIICIGNTLPHLNPEKLKQFAETVPSWLNKDGLLIIQTVNYHKIVSERPLGLSTIERPEEGVKFTRLYEYNSDGSIAFTAVLDSLEGRSQSTVTLWPFTAAEFKQGLPSSLKVDAEYGGFSGAPYDQKKSEAWVLSAKI